MSIKSIRNLYYIIGIVLFISLVGCQSKPRPLTLEEKQAIAKREQAERLKRQKNNCINEANKKQEAYIEICGSENDEKCFSAKFWKDYNNCMNRTIENK